MTLLEIRIMAGSLILLCLLVGYASWHHHVDQCGYKRAEAEWQKKEQAAKIESDKVLFAANEGVRKSQGELSTIREQIIAKTQELENAKAERDHLIADYRAGTKRVSILGAACKGSATKQDSRASAAGEPSQERCELLPETAASVLDIARRYRDDVQKLNECIELYNAVETAVNTP
jgi:hypothetical protein